MKWIPSALFTVWTDNSGSDRFLYLVYAAIWQFRKCLGQSAVTKLANGAALKVYPHTAFSGAFYTRWIERKDLLFIRANADLAPTFVDIGANVGLFSVSLFDRFLRFVLIEPTSACINALHETCALNPTVECEIIDAAVSDRLGTAFFLDEGNFSTTSRLVAGEPTSTEVKSITLETLDHLLLNREENFVVKVDVEGHEEQVFRGAEKLLRAKRIKLLMFERLGRTNIDNIIRFFDLLNYEIFFVLEDGSVTLNSSALRKPLINLFACPRAEFPRIAERSSATHDEL